MAISKLRFNEVRKLDLKELTPSILRKLYIDNEYSISDIAGLCNCSEQSIAYRLSRDNIPRRNSNIKLEPSADIAYILGTCLGDGWVSKDGYKIELQVKSEIFMNKFKDSLNRIGLTAKTYYLDKGHYRTVSSSKIFTNWYNDLSYYNIRNIVVGYEKHFIQGMWDSEGSYNNGSICIYNTDVSLLELVKELMIKLGIYCKINGPYVHKQGFSDNCELYHVRVMGGKRYRDVFFNLIDNDVKGM